MFCKKGVASNFTKKKSMTGEFEILQKNLFQKVSANGCFHMFREYYSNIPRSLKMLSLGDISLIRLRF